MAQLAIDEQASCHNHGFMTHWTSRLARAFGTVFRSPGSGRYPADFSDLDADGRRVRRELDAIRIRFPGHG
jgi:hypothetical protein